MHGFKHGITKYGVHSLMQIALAMDKELTDWQDSAPNWLSKSSRQLEIWLVAHMGDRQQFSEGGS